MSDHPPNIVFVFADQMRAEAMGCMGNDQVQTPNLDRLADEGLLFPNAYSSNPVCGPARACILTGQYTHANGMLDNKMQLSPSERSLGNCLQDGGYNTGYIGKWHLHYEHETGRPGHVPPDESRHGFKYWKGFNSGHHHMKGHPHFDEEGNVEWEEGYQPEVQTDLALEFIEKHQDGPFGLFMSWGPPHGPRDAPQRYHDMYDPQELNLRPNVPDELDNVGTVPDGSNDVRTDLADYYASITALDDNFGRLLDRLDELGIAENTIVVFTADHGDMMGSQGRYGKDIPHEEAIHIPLILRYPEEVTGGRTSDAVVGLIDYMPTLLSLADIPVPGTVQGNDLSAHIREEGMEESTPDSHFIEGSLLREYPWRALRTQRYLITINENLEIKHLFDMEEDPYQMNNLVEDDSITDVKDDLYDQLVENIYEYDDQFFMVRDVIPEWGLEYSPPGF